MSEMNDLNYAERELMYWYNSPSDNFHSLLFHLIAKADMNNKAKLKLAYPDEVKAFDRYMNEGEFWKTTNKEQK